MNTSEVIFRPISRFDNDSLADLIKSVLKELDVPKKGTTYEDIELSRMYETFSHPRAAYYVIEQKQKLLGGAGIIQLKNEAEEICELQKMYLLPEARGRGLGKRLLEICIKEASELGYNQCYLETMSNMLTAQELYKRAGFKYLEERMGTTGHYVCPIWMIREI